MISSEFVLKLNERNLCTWYILPLVGLNPAYFVDVNFVNSYLVKDKMQIAVEIYSPDLCYNLQFVPSYEKTTEMDMRFFMIFNIHEGWKRDVDFFTAGLFSQFSEEAKRCIIEVSGLSYKTPDENGSTHTSAILMALDRSVKLRDAWILELEVDEEHLPEELLSIPGESSYIEL